MYYCILVVSITLYRGVGEEVSVTENLTEMLKGVLEGCVIEIIDRGETYGYEITRKLNELGFADVVEGTVYTILLRLERNGFVDVGKKSTTLGPPRKIYALNNAGREELMRFWERWTFVASKLYELKGETTDEEIL
jgi:DNA-binding PadR family transcriptional regulator